MPTNYYKLLLCCVMMVFFWGVYSCGWDFLPWVRECAKEKRKKRKDLDVIFLMWNVGLKLFVPGFVAAKLLMGVVRSVGSVEGHKSIHDRRGPLNHAAAGSRRIRVCYYFQKGNCNRCPCPFLHVRSSELRSDGDGAVNSSVGKKRGSINWVRDHGMVKKGNVAPPANPCRRVTPAYKASGASATVASKTSIVEGSKVPAASVSVSGGVRGFSAATKFLISPSKVSDDLVDSIGATKVPAASACVSGSFSVSAAAAKFPISSTKVSGVVVDSIGASKVFPSRLAPDTVSKASTASATVTSFGASKISVAHPTDPKPSVFKPSKAVSGVTASTTATKFSVSSAKASDIVVDSTGASKAASSRGTPDTLFKASIATAPGKCCKICDRWISGECSDGANCRCLHSWSVGDGYALLASLAGHKKSVTGIALAEACEKLYTGGKDGTLRIWDGQTGQCAKTINVGAKVGCLIDSGSWIFVGLPNLVKAWNFETSVHLCLFVPGGQVYALAIGNNYLFVGAEDGSILAWRFNAVGNCFDPPVSLTGHNLAVTSLYVGSVRLYSGSKDNTVKVWDLANLQCLHTLRAHTSAVMSVLCWDQYLLSSSLDNTIKVWGVSEKGVEVIHTHKEEHGILNLCGVFDSDKKPVLLCSCNDNVVRLYDMPSGRIFSNGEVGCLQGSPNGLFFTGSRTGEVKVWKWLSKEGTAPVPTT